MNQDRWQRVKDLYNSALEIEPEKRQAFLLDACAGDRNLRGEVERLLARQPDAENFIESPALQVVARRLGANSSQQRDGDTRTERSRPMIGKTPGYHQVTEKLGATRRPPWWMYLVLVPCTAYILSVWYVHLTGPETWGFMARPDPKGLTVELVQPGLAAARAGLQAGDVILSVNGASPFSRENRAHVGKRYEITVQRQGEPKTIVITLGRKGRAFWTDVEGVVQLADVPIAALCITLAWLTALRRPDDATARLGSMVLALWPVTLIHLLHGLPSGLFEFLVGMPVLLAVVPVAAICLALGPFHALILMFFASFPRKLVQGRWIWILAWLPAAIGFAGGALASARLLYDSALRLPLWLARPSAMFRTATLVAMPILLVWSYRTLKDINERRRTRVMMLGVAVSLVASIPDIGVLAFSSQAVRRLVYAYYFSPFYLLGALASAMGPCSIAYATLRHRVFDLGVIVRQGLQYAAARNILLALGPFFGIVLVGDLALHSNQTITQAFVERGWFYAALGAAATAAHLKRNTWLGALDRRFFRERYDSQRILRTVLTDVRQATTLEQAAPQVMAQIDAALHPESSAILIREAHQTAFRVLASAGIPQTPPEIRSDCKLMALVRVLGKPVEVQQSETGWLRRQLPQEESEWLAAARIEWIFPVSLGEKRTEVLLALAPKRSQEPYAREDQELIDAITSGLGLLVERITSLPQRGVQEVRPESAVPQITERYVLRRELGRGGMGAVFEGFDRELERPVAIKVMRPELLASGEAAARFKREARAAAGFTHPNVVTVYDFGVSEAGFAYLVMELLSGCTLREAQPREGRLIPLHAASILRGVCSAVEAAHERSLLHRDLKPENIFLVRSRGSEIPKVLDFGVAKPMRAEADALTLTDTAPGQLLGTLAYMSPEQLKALPPSPGWDLWALAVIAFEMVTGAHPFAGEGMSLQAAVLTGVPASTQPFLGAEGACWDEYFSRALAAAPECRPSSARDLLAGFEATVARQDAAGNAGA